MSFSKDLITDLMSKKVNYEASSYCDDIEDPEKILKEDDLDLTDLSGVEKKFGKEVPTDYISINYSVDQVFVKVYGDIPGVEPFGIPEGNHIEFILHKDREIFVDMSYPIKEDKESVISSLRDYLESLGYKKIFFEH